MESDKNHRHPSISSLSPSPFGEGPGEALSHVYLIGIGGIGMSGLARYFHKRGCTVTGYDRTRTELTNELEKEGIAITYSDNIEEIPANLHVKTDSALIIYTPAIPKDSVILNFFIAKGFELKKRSQVLGLISKEMFTIAVAGTHGKTTTSTMAAHILKHSGFDCTAFLGGIASNYNTNILFGKNNVMVVEADEYDRSFLTLHPDIAIITSMDADHLDIYGNDESVKDGFKLFASQLKKGGTLIHKKGLPLDKGTTYSASETADVIAENVCIKNGTFYFDFRTGAVVIKDIELGLPGLHNIENSVGAIQAALLLGIQPDKIKNALRDFTGIKRRFEYIVKNDQHIFIDDYAHHPEELRACITAVRSLYPDKKLTVLFQPHLFTRTRDFVDGFAEVLSMSDELLLLDIYPARELPIEGVTSEIILNKVTASSSRICGMQESLEIIKSNKPELLVTVGAGDIDTLVQPLKEILTNA
ncbi:MAG TPA: UDP-N-acetylmuramate--L-alanine ligase [Pedobacter sp.]|jgi:UDP-N-acetylmuramate--alanine ligase